MSKLVFFTVLCMFFTSSAFAAEVTLVWDPSEGAIGYKIQKSIDLGATWSTPIDVGNVTMYKFTGVEENTLVLFRVSAYNQIGEAIRTEAGAWYDHRKKPPIQPLGLGVK